MVVEKQRWEEKMVVCLVWSGELSIYRWARVLRGRVGVDMGAAVPAS